MRLMTRFNATRQMMRRYSPEELLKSINALLKNIRESGDDGGKILKSVILIPLLLVCVFILRALMILRDFLRKFVETMRSWFTISIQEANFYWGKVKERGVVLAADLSVVSLRLQKYVEHLTEKLGNEQAQYAAPTAQASGSNGAIFLSLLGWIALTIVSIVMSILLVVLFFVCFGGLHRKVRSSFTPVSP